MSEQTLISGERAREDWVRLQPKNPDYFVEGPTRYALEIEDIGEAYLFTERIPGSWEQLEQIILPKDNH